MQHVPESELMAWEPDPSSTDKISNLAAQGLPIILPWNPFEIRLGRCFSSRLLSTGHDPWLNNSPFNLFDLFTIPKILMQENGTTASYTSVETSRMCETDDHLSLGLGASVGPPGLSSVAAVGAKGTFDQQVRKNDDSNKASFRSSVRAANIAFERLPRLSHEAIKAIKYGGGYEALCDSYGDYFVASYVLGGETGMLVSSASDSKDQVDAYGITATATMLFVESSNTWTKDFHEFNAHCAFKMVGYDTLEKKNWNTSMDGDGIALFQDHVEQVTLRSQSMTERLQLMLDTRKLAHGQSLSMEQCEELAASGAVIELLLLPMSRLRDVVQWRNEDNII